DAAGDQRICIELREPTQLGTVVEQAGVEEVGAQAARLGLELAKAQHARIDRELHERLRQPALFSRLRVGNHHGEDPCSNSPASISTASAPPPARGSKAGWPAIAPIVFACRRSRPRPLTWRDASKNWRASKGISSWPKKRVIRVWRFTPGTNRAMW